MRIPKSLAADAHLRETSTVDVRLVDDKIIITLTNGPAFTLNELLARVTDENLHPETPL